jgi:hypothetical protein
VVARPDRDGPDGHLAVTHGHAFRDQQVQDHGVGAEPLPDLLDADHALGHGVNHPRRGLALDEQDARDPDERGTLGDLEGRRLVRRCASGIDLDPTAAKLEPAPTGVYRVRLQPLEARL